MLLSPLHAPTALVFHANISILALKTALYSQELSIKSSHQSYERRFLNVVLKLFQSSQWSVIYEYGLGVPKNKVVVKTLYLYSQKVKIYQLADKMWAVVQDKNPKKYIPKQSKILALLKAYQ